MPQEVLDRETEQVSQSDLPTWRDFERIEREVHALAEEVRNQKTMSREDIIDRLTLIAERFKDSLEAVEKETQSRVLTNEKSIAAIRSLVERVIVAVIGSLVAGVLSLLIEIIRLLAPRSGG